MHPLLESLPADQQARLVPGPAPVWEEPMLATLTHDYFSDPGWVFGRKLDGVRCITYRDGNTLRLMSRTRNEMSASFPEIRDAFEALPAGAYVLDGEVVAFRDGQTDFQLLQPRMGLINPADARATGIPVFYYLFDILYFEGFDVTRLPLASRKSILAHAAEFRDPLRLLEDRPGDGLAYLKEACQSGWEGLIAKRADGPYVHGRSGDWLKFKCTGQQEFVIGGWTEPKGKRIELGALLLGYYDHGRFRYAGKVGTGFDDRTLRALKEKLTPLARPASPFDEQVRENEVHWVEPQLVAEIGFENWTREGRLRQPRYRGLRYDKDPKSVVREG
ncbi:MAG: DNA ligase [Methanocella sp. PtaU1.Bin125]|nr:MAG: DNA ligase [Methanocella sp. PtaU1.Bin125]